MYKYNNTGIRYAQNHKCSSLQGASWSKFRINNENMYTKCENRLIIFTIIIIYKT